MVGGASPPLNIVQKVAAPWFPLMAKAVSNDSKNVVMSTESAEAVKANLQQVAEEIARVRDRTKEEVESLDRIRGMLDLKYLNDLLSVIDSLENRVRQMEQGTEALRWKNELENEQRRLAKLWDAFKTQEDQLRAIERERDDILAQYRNYEKQFADFGGPQKLKQRVAELENTNKRIGIEHEAAASRLEKYVSLFTQEQERLAKLYKVWEDTEARRAALERQLGRAPRAAPAAKAPRPKKAKKASTTSRGNALAYAREMKELRKRAKKSRGGKGPIEKRASARKLRAKYGIKAKK